MIPKWWFAFIAVIGVLILVEVARTPQNAGLTTASHVPIATRQAMATMFANQDRIAALIVFDAHPQLSVSTNLEDVAATVGITNRDTTAHTFTPQADFYQVAKDKLGDDPASFLVTAGYTQITLAAGQQQTVTIHAKNFNHDPVVSIDFRVTGLP